MRFSFKLPGSDWWRTSDMTTVHVWPDGDFIEHDTDGGDCACQPTTEAVFRDDGSNGWLVTHNSIAELWARIEEANRG